MQAFKKQKIFFDNSSFTTSVKTSKHKSSRGSSTKLVDTSNRTQTSAPSSMNAMRNDPDSSIITGQWNLTFFLTGKKAIIAAGMLIDNSRA